MAKSKASAGPDAADANVVLVFTKSGDETWPTVAEAFSLDDAVVDTEAPTDEEPDDEVAPPSINRDAAPPPPPPATHDSSRAGVPDHALYNIDWTRNFEATNNWPDPCLGEARGRGREG